MKSILSPTNGGFLNRYDNYKIASDIGKTGSPLAKAAINDYVKKQAASQGVLGIDEGRTNIPYSVDANGMNMSLDGSSIASVEPHFKSSGFLDGFDWKGAGNLALGALNLYSGYQQNKMAKQALNEQRRQFDEYMAYQLDEQAMNKATARTAAQDTGNFLKDTGLGGANRIASYENLAATLA